VQELLIKQMNANNAECCLFTGLTCMDDHTLAITSSTHVALLKLVPEWSAGRRWPRAFMRAAQTMLLIHKFGEAHAKADSRSTHGLWSLPQETLDSILQKAAGSRSEWLKGAAKFEPPPDAASFYGVPRAALTSTLIQEPLVHLYLTGAWLFAPDQFQPPQEEDASLQVLLGATSEDWEGGSGDSEEEEESDDDDDDEMGSEEEEFDTDENEYEDPDDY
jgi:hypothetical protein